MDRRTVLKTGTALGIAAAVGLPAKAFVAQNRSPLQLAAYLRLKPGAVRAAGRLATQLDKQVNGLCGHYPETSHFLQFDNTGWIHPNLGDPLWSDRAEELAFNSLPAALDPAGRAVHHITSANGIDLDNVAKTMAQFQNGFAMQSYRAGVDQYRCCPHNYGMAWPYFVEEMWLGTPHGGLCAALLGPCTVTSSFTIVENTTYPFGDTVTFTIQTSSPVAFPLSIRVPGWCASPDLRVNGSVVSSGAGPRFARISRTWSNGGTVTLRLPMSPVVKAWPAQHNAVSVNYGALTFSLRITENWTQTGGRAVGPPGVDPLPAGGEPDRRVSHGERVRNSGNVLGVSNMSLADSAQVEQFDDNGTVDHRWRLTT